MNDHKTDGIGSARARARRQRSVSASLLGIAVSVLACGPPQAERISIWDASDESNLERVDHRKWQEILDEYVDADPSGVNVVDYAALATNPADVVKLDGYLEHLQGIDPRVYRRVEQMAYWINLYNAVTVKVVLDAYPVESIKQVHEGVVPLTGPWNDVHASVAGQDLTLDQIEHGILRPIWRDERIHYAVNCAAYGCPHLIETAFTAANTESLLEAGARAFVNSPRGVDVVDDDFVVISSIYDWYANDFGGTEKSVIEHLIDHADSELAEFLEAFEGAIEYDYDWNLNEP